MKYIAKTFKLFIPILVFGIYVLFIFLQDAVIRDKNSVWTQAIGEFVLSALYVVSIVCISRALFRKSTKKVRCDWRIVSFLVFLCLVAGGRAWHHCSTKPLPSRSSSNMLFVPVGLAQSTSLCSASTTSIRGD